MRDECYAKGKCRWAIPVGDGLKYCPYNKCPALNGPQLTQPKEPREIYGRLYDLVKF